MSNKLTMLDVEVHWFPGDDWERDNNPSGLPQYEESDPPGWVPFLRLSDETLAYPGGLGTPLRSRKAAIFASYFIVWDNERETSDYTGPPMLHERAARDGSNIT